MPRSPRRARPAPSPAAGTAGAVDGVGPFLGPATVRAALMVAALGVVLGAVLGVGGGAVLGADRAAASTDSGSAPGTPAPPRGGSGSLPAGPTAPRYQPPVLRPVVDPFRAPAGPYGPGNRGLEYATLPGDVAGAIGPGVVVFAGDVGGRGVVSVIHPDGLRSALTGLAGVTARPGQVVVAGTPLGTAGPLLHLGVRDGDRYVDPALLFGPPSRPRHAILVPNRGLPASGPPGP